MESMEAGGVARLGAESVGETAAHIRSDPEGRALVRMRGYQGQPSVATDVIMASAPLEMVSQKRSRPDQGAQQILDRDHPEGRKVSSGFLEARAIIDRGPNADDKKDTAPDDAGRKWDHLRVLSRGMVGSQCHAVQIEE